MQTKKGLDPTANIGSGRLGFSTYGILVLLHFLLLLDVRSDYRICTYRLSHLGEENMLLFSAFQALMVGLKSATVVANVEQHSH